MTIYAEYLFAENFIAGLWILQMCIRDRRNIYDVGTFADIGETLIIPGIGRGKRRGTGSRTVCIFRMTVEADDLDRSRFCRILSYEAFFFKGGQVLMDR